MSRRDECTPLSGPSWWLLLAFSLALVFFGWGCQTAPTKTVILGPPVDLIADCPEPSSSAVTNEDLVNRFIDMRAALRVCNADKRALRAWLAEISKENPER